ncbi:MAG: FxsA family protein [Acidimicrobiaceae bacterium]|nr:FxsA family protein [Acidimicrobiaceae bacterium]MCY4176257.1 FxsA family protein [Acidimicrobiaceae bacterium]MCY4280235.1 FxsA family protein [Acidimicrobiaceae bacterium]MCY4293583.1 FxsA family protein [Acidimicrobiaceae bacterium]
MRTLGPYARNVFGVLLLLLLGMPLLELYVIIVVADQTGAGAAIALLVLVSVVGAWMVRRSGIGVLNQIRRRLDDGQLPAKELVDGVLILVAGALMLTPGFVTDAVGLGLLLLPVRVLTRNLLMRRFVRRVTLAAATPGPGSWQAASWDVEAPPGGSARRGQRDVWDVQEVREARQAPGRGPVDPPDVT